jgi:lipopolysaccharide export system protein LptA
VIVLIGLFCRTEAWSTEGAADEPPQLIYFWADQSVIYTKANRAVLSGNVKVKQGESTATADRMIIIFSKAGGQQSGIDLNSIEKIEFQDQVRIEFDDNVAVAQNAVYFSAQRKLVLSGPGTKITSGQNELNCNTVTYFRNEGRMECTGDGEAQVKAIIHSSGSGLN